MKLLFCKACQDLFRLTSTERVCSCGETRGRYVEDTNAVYSGELAVPLGIANSSFAHAVIHQPRGASVVGERFEAFVVSEGCNTFWRED